MSCRYVVAAIRGRDDLGRVPTYSTSAHLICYWSYAKFDLRQASLSIAQPTY